MRTVLTLLASASSAAAIAAAPALLSRRASTPQMGLDETSEKKPVKWITPAVSGDWLVSSIAQQRLLDLDEEKVVTRSVCEYTRWRKIRDDLEKQLGRKPTYSEWSDALISGGEVALQAFLAEPSPEDAQRQFLRRLREQEDAWRELVHCNMRLVVSIARRHSGRGLPLHDLVQEGAVGLMAAAEKFEPHRGHKFSTYATYWIRQAITRALQNSGSNIRLPTYMHARISAIQKARALAAQSGVLPSDEEVAHALGMDLDVLQRALEAEVVGRGTVSLEGPVRRSMGMGSEGVPLHARLADEKRRLPESLLHANEEAAALRQLLHTALDDEERAAVGLRFGLVGGVAQSYPSISSSLQMSNARRARRVVERALKKLRVAAEDECMEGALSDALSREHAAAL